MSEKKRFVILLALAVASVILLLVVRHNIGQNFVDQL